MINGQPRGEIGNTSVDTVYQRKIRLPDEYLSFNYVIGVSCSETPMLDADINITVVNDEENTEDKNFVRIGYFPSEKEKAIILNQQINEVLYKMETQGRLLPVNSPALNKTLSALFMPVFQRSEKEIMKLLKYRVKGGRKL